LAVESAAASRGRRSSASAPLARFDLDEFGDDGDAFRLGEARYSCALGFNSKARAVLRSDRNALGDQVAFVEPSAREALNLRKQVQLGKAFVITEMLL
jgi:hypothetical protein